MLGNGWGMICTLLSSGVVSGTDDQGREDLHRMQMVVERLN